MGLLDVLRLAPSIADKSPADVTALSFESYLPNPNQFNLSLDAATQQYVTRIQAMTVPAMARARSIIAGTGATLPLKSYIEATGATIEGRKLIDQPDPALPREVTLAWTLDDLMFYGVAYWQVLDLDPADGRPSQARRIDPLRIGYKTDNQTQTIQNYQLDGKDLPLKGRGSLVVFWGLDEGILARGGRTLKTAMELEAAALRMAQEPVPQMILRNRGMNLPADQKQSLLSAFKQARQSRSTAYLEGDLDLDIVGFDSAQLQLTEGRAYCASEIARMASIPAWYLNAESASATYSNVSSERRSLIDFCLRNYLKPLEARLSMDDVTPRGQEVEFELDDFLRGNATERIDNTVKLLDAGIIDLPEARAMEDLAPRGVNTPDA